MLSRHATVTVICGAMMLGACSSRREKPAAVVENEWTGDEKDESS